ncbi:MAG: hypothetical protein ACKO7W_08690 [Elainella sp.]
MTILIANLGTSDVSIQVEVEDWGKPRYIPIGFDRNERNLKPPQDNEEEQIWNVREEIVLNQLCPELGVEVTVYKGKRSFSFRDFTERLWQAYITAPEQWHHRIRPGRIWGVIKAAQQQFGVEQVYLFVTDQPHFGDTIFLFEILKQWLKQEKSTLALVPHLIHNAVEQDVLFQDYYQFFNRISQRQGDDTEILISTKGGTPQMQTALQMQAMASTVRFQAHLEPQLSVTRVLEGEPSPCIAGVYWQYARSQKYQVVKLLLNNRWDFAGAEQILRDWQSFLERLVERGIADQEVTAGNQQLEQVLIALQIAQTWLNLDDRSAKALIAQHPQIAQAAGLAALSTSQPSKLLNLYTQCRILWQLDEVANFLPRMGSFCEAVMDLVIWQFLGKSDAVDSRWKVCQEKIEAKWGTSFWHHFAQVEGEKNSRFKPQRKRDGTWYDISGRYSKRNFAQAIVDHQSDLSIQENWARLLDLLQQLDYWANKRNELIHGAEGISKREMRAAYEDEIEKLQSSRQRAATIKKKAPSLDQPSSSSKSPQAALPTYCSPDDILQVMEQLCRNSLVHLSVNESSCYIGTHARYYLYSEIRDYVLGQLI